MKCILLCFLEKISSAILQAVLHWFLLFHKEILAHFLHALSYVSYSLPSNDMLLFATSLKHEAACSIM